ncbi:uncharacterized protein Dwil_GK28100 [Drosophila willistoni]|uniref:Chitin-binding type-2 domain-containing protein n=1 Tax=Drosophila willistoni TaxID=7260 RepID=A0A0Q9X0G8_DROWI|nr:uncharacterized protein Dwil_GK28100 [Drosophila willistoni]
MHSLLLVDLVLGLLGLLSISSARNHMTMRADIADCKEGTLYPNSTSTGGYMYCSGGVLHSEECPTGTYFDSNYQICRHGTPPSSSSTDGSSLSGLCQRPGLTADLLDCNQYYHCSGKGAQLDHNYCPVGYIFDTSKYTCISGSC